MNKEQSLIIWNQNGSTMKFEKVENFDVAFDGEISFNYFGVSTKKGVKQRSTLKILLVML